MLLDDPGDERPVGDVALVEIGSPTKLRGPLSSESRITGTCPASSSAFAVIEPR